MNYSQEITYCAAASGASWEGANAAKYLAPKLALRAGSFMFGALAIGFIMLQCVELNR
jgi:hypothetical protein